MKTYRIIKVRASARGIPELNVHPSLAPVISTASEGLEEAINAAAQSGWEPVGSPFAEGTSLCCLLVKKWEPKDGHPDD